MGSENNVTIPAEIPDPADELEIQSPEIEIEGEQPAKAEEPAKTADDGIEALKKQLEAEKARRVQVEQQARQTEEEATRYRSQAERSRADNLANAVDLATQEVDKQKAAYRQALEAGDYNAATDAQEALATAAAAKLAATNMRAAYEAQLRAKPEPPKQQTTTFTPATQAWIDKHPEFHTDAEFREMASFADKRARREGLAVDSPDYFARVDELMGFTPKEEPKPQPRTTSVPAAPVSRGNVQPNSGGREVYRLSQEEKAFCEQSGIDEREYAKNKALAAKQAATA